jgi:hypothetical protein
MTVVDNLYAKRYKSLFLKTMYRSGMSFPAGTDPPLHRSVSVTAGTTMERRRSVPVPEITGSRRRGGRSVTAGTRLPLRSGRVVTAGTDMERRSSVPVSEITRSERRSGGVVTAVTESGRRRRILVTAVTTPDLKGFGVVALFLFAQEALTWHLKRDGNWPSFTHRSATPD